MKYSDITFIDTADIRNKRVLLRVDFNVSLNPNTFTISDDERVKQAVPTIKYLLERGNKLILASHLGRPKDKRDPKYSMRIICENLENYFPDHKIELIDDFMTQEIPDSINQDGDGTIYVLENTRFYPGEKSGDVEFTKRLASLAQVYVNDAFGVCHRADASVVGITNYLPSYGGLLLKKEIEMIGKITDNPERPVLAIVGGAKIETKIKVIEKLLLIADNVFVGGALANTFLYALGNHVGKSIYEHDEKDAALSIIKADTENRLSLPTDCVYGDPQELEHGGTVTKISELPENTSILDIGPETQAKLGALIARARTIIWNGPVGYFENIHYRHGTDFLYYAICENTDAVSIIGGGDTISAIAKKEYLEKITHISTGGGAMLEFIEKGTLVGIEALRGKGKMLASQ